MEATQDVKDEVKKRIIIEDKDDLEDVIRLIGDAEDDLEAKKAYRDKAIRRAKDNYDPKIKRLRSRLNRLSRAALQYCRKRRVELLEGVKGKTCTLSTGKVAFRKGKKKVVFEDSKDAIIDRLEKRGLGELVTVRKSVSKSTIMKHRERVNGIEGISIEREDEQIKIEPFPKM